MNYLNVTYAEKDQAKSLGARWDADGKRWYVPDGLNLEPFNRWLPNGLAVESASTDQSSQGVTLFEFLRQASQALKKALPGEHWIRAEISQCKILGGGHLSIELVEHNELGQLSARVSAFIWAANVGKITGQFMTGTGGSLATGLKVMVKASIDMSLTHNLRLVITDIDPSYTLGDIEANLKKIRETLTQEGVIKQNAQLARPMDFCRVAIISPNGAAGLGDFKRDADVLESYALCQFDYFSAPFQGQGAAAGILAAIEAVHAQHVEHRYDALCIIRGGGSVTDLYWLNDLALARAICVTPIPVFSGIGHERDNTIVDEVAHTRFDTPSKVVGHIGGTIYTNAMQAEENFRSAMLYAQRLTAMAESQVESVFVALQQDATKATQVMSHRVEHLYQSILPAAKQWIYRAEQENEQLFMLIYHRCSTDLAAVMAEITRYHDYVITGTQHILSGIELSLEQTMQSVMQHAALRITDAENRVKGLGREILGIGPKATLNRGFAIARTTEGVPVVSVEQAKQCPELNIEFRDGILNVKPTGQKL